MSSFSTGIIIFVPCLAAAKWASSIMEEAADQRDVTTEHESADSERLYRGSLAVDMPKAVSTPAASLSELSSISDLSQDSPVSLIFPLNDSSPTPLVTAANSGGGIATAGMGPISVRDRLSNMLNARGRYTDLVKLVSQNQRHK